MKRLQALTAIVCAATVMAMGSVPISTISVDSYAAEAEVPEDALAGDDAAEDVSDSEQKAETVQETEPVEEMKAADETEVDAKEEEEASDEIEIIKVNDYTELTEYAPADLDTASSYTVDLSLGEAEGSNEEVLAAEDAFELDEALYGDDLAEAIDESDIYILDQAQSDGSTAVVYSPYARHRVVVYSDEMITDTFGATEGAYLTADGGYRLCYEDEAATKEAYDALAETYGEEAVLLDLPVAISTTATGTEPNGWGTSYMHLDGISQKVANNHTGQDISVAILDTGIKVDHEVFKGKTISSLSTSVIGGNIADENGHGTAVAGIIAESTSDNVALMPIKIADQNGESSLDYMLAGLNVAAANGASVANLSMNACFADAESLTNAQIQEDILTLESYMKGFAQKGLIICVSAGNDNRNIRNAYNYPAMSQYVLCTGSIGSGEKRSSFSSYGADLDFVAPGEDIVCAWSDSVKSWKKLSGTSMASPYLTAACAMIKSTTPNADLAAVEKQLADLSKDLGAAGKDNEYGYGVPIFTETASYTGENGNGGASGDASTLIDGVKLPADWDPNDPGSYKAYEQMYGIVSEEQHFSNGSGSPLLKASYIVAKTKWRVYGESTYAEYQHDSKNTTGSDIIPIIDVSYHNGTIDWDKVKADGVQGVMIRCGYRGRADGELYTDTKFYQNIKAAKAAGLQVGVYFFSQAITTKEGQEEAEYAMARIKDSGVKIDLPIAIDVEYYSSGSNRLKNQNLSINAQTDIAAAFCSRVKSNGYTPMVYASSVFLVEHLDGSAILQKGYQIWMARYRYAAYSNSSTFFNEPVTMWQCTSQAAVNGINTEVDLNYWYRTGGYNGWKQDATGWYWKNENGTLAKDKWIKWGGYWYYLKANGYMAENEWAKDSSGWCWLRSGGKMATSSWIKSGGEWYYVNGGGHRVTNGWAKDSKGWCWLGADGKIVKNKWIKPGGVWYYLKSNGYMAANEWTKDSAGWMWMASNGKITKSQWIKSSGYWYYLKSNGYMAANSWAKDSVGWCYLGSNGKIVKSKWIKWGGYWYYLKSNGYMAANEYAKDSKKTYWMNSSGRISN